MQFLSKTFLKPVFKRELPLGDCNGIRTHKHLAWKRTLNHLDKIGRLTTCLSVRLQS